MSMFFSKRRFTIGIVALLALITGVSLLLLTTRKVPAPVPVEQVSEEVYPVKQVIGTSLEGRPIEAYTYGDGDKKLVFVGGIHGGYEWNSVLLAYGVMDYLEEHPDIIPDSVSVVVVPVMNPDGLFKVTQKEGRFSVSDVSKDQSVLAEGRFNARGVDLNRNFDCRWQPTSMWRSRQVSAGTAPMSEPESQALVSLVSDVSPQAVVFWHSQADTVYASECDGNILSITRDIMNEYADASGYKRADSFTAYAITGDAGDWLAKIGIPAISVELTTHETIEFEKNMRGVEALFEYFGR